MEWIKLNGNSDDILPSGQGRVLAAFDNGSIEDTDIKNMFANIPCGLDENGTQLYTKWYLHLRKVGLKVLYWLDGLPESTMFEIEMDDEGKGLDLEKLGIPALPKED